MTARAYGTRLAGMTAEPLRGKFIVVEGPDGSGRSTEVARLKEWLEVDGHSVVDTGLRRSDLVSAEIDRAKQGHTLAATTMALLYAADFADQLENKIIPALAAGSTVLADRYIYTLMARAIVRGASRAWARGLYSFGLQPDRVIFLAARPEILLHRAIAKYGSLDYWESGMDLCLSRDLFESFFLYQALLEKEFVWMADEFAFHRVDANRSPERVHQEVRALVGPLYAPPSSRSTGRTGERARVSGARRRRAASV